MTDFLVVCLSVIFAQGIRFGFSDGFTTVIGGHHLPAYVMTVAIVVGWMVALQIAHAADRQVLAVGVTEYNRVLAACFGFFGALAIVDVTFRLSIARGFIAVVFPVGTVALLISRWLWRRRIARGRRRGRFLHSVLAIGTAESVVPLTARLAKNPALGYEVVGVCVPDPVHQMRVTTATDAEPAATPVYVGVEQVSDALIQTGATAVAVADTGVLSEGAMHELAWTLHADGVDLLVAPGLAGVSGPRITMRPEAGLPLLHVAHPRYQRAGNLAKLSFDKLATTVGLLVIAPILVAIAVAVKIDSRGPVFYRAERIGANNEPFLMWKFRSMVDGADNQQAALAGRDEGNGVLFKIRDDPRVTRVGRILRAFSLDELPQLFNVMSGNMSLVGPRPPLRSEVEGYDRTIVRRMLVRPGMTGLWQVSGRSDLSWEESVQLDLNYVENWSLAGDLVILWRTGRAVLKREGAY